MTDPIPVRLAAGSGETFGVDDLSCAAATDLGLWRDEGLEPAWTPVHGGVRAIEALMEGRVDVAYGGLGPALAARAGGAPVRIVVSMARALAQNLVVQNSIGEPERLRGCSWGLDGFGALSHHMARLTVRALGISEDEIEWRALGPPPERIEALLEGSIDVSLIRVEEALSLSARHPDKLRTLLGFGDLKRLVPMQPHGVLSTTEAFEAEAPDTLARVTRGMIRASRTLHSDEAAFERVFRGNAIVELSTDEIGGIWRQERDNGGFAVNGEMSTGHWDAQFADFRELNPTLREVTQDEILARGFVRDALAALDPFPSDFDPPEG